MPNLILTCPDAPFASAQRLVAAQQRAATLPAALVEPVTAILGRWLTAHPECHVEAGKPDRTWCESARRAHQQGQPCMIFRRRKRITEEAEKGLKWIAIVARYASDVRDDPPHADASVRSEAEKLIRALRGRRMTWEQLAEGLKRVRSLVRTRGRQRAANTAVRDPLKMAVPGGYSWREIVTTRELTAVGRANGWCTHEPEYLKQLKEKAVRFFVLEEEGGDELLALISFQSRSRTVEGARAPFNEPIPLAHREAVWALLDHFGVATSDCSDLLAIGLTSAVPGAVLREPDIAIGDMSVWFGPAGEAVEETPAILIGAGAGFALLRPISGSLSEVRFRLDASARANFDSDDLLGRLLIGMGGRP